MAVKAVGMRHKLMKVIRFLARILDRLTDLSFYAGALTVPFIAVSVSYEVVMRYFIGQATEWITEISGYLLFYLTWLAAAWVLKQEGHVRIDIVLNRFSQRNQEVINKIISFICAFMMLALFVSSSLYTREIFQTTEVAFHVALSYPKWILILPCPIGSFLFFFQFLRRAWRRTGLFA